MKEYLLHTTDSITRNSVRNLSLRRPTSALCFVDRNKLQSASSRLPRSHRVMSCRLFPLYKYCLRWRLLVNSKALLDVQVRVNFKKHCCYMIKLLLVTKNYFTIANVCCVPLSIPSFSLFFSLFLSLSLSLFIVFSSFSDMVFAEEKACSAKKTTTKVVE